MDNPKDMFRAEDYWKEDIKRGVETVNRFLDD